jgi:hypothetical protein
MPQWDKERGLAVAQLVTGIGILIFWLLFFTAGMAPANPPACYFAFEHSFPPPDFLLALGLIASGAGGLNWYAWSGSGRLSLACAGGLLFLGLIDLSFAAQNGGFSGPAAEVAQASLISGWCIALGLAIILFAPRPS